jgi:hypothetical protein
LKRRGEEQGLNPILSIGASPKWANAAITKLDAGWFPQMTSLIKITKEQKSTSPCSYLRQISLLPLIGVVVVMVMMVIMMMGILLLPYPDQDLCTSGLRHHT